MAKAVLIAYRPGAQHLFSIGDIRKLLERLAPPDIQVRSPIVNEESGVVLGVYNPADSITVRGTSVCLGSFQYLQEDWWKPEGSISDGPFALMRAHEDRVEIMSDILATRTIWYVLEKDFFAASTSQRILVSLLGNFRFRKAVIPWMLSSGHLGPGFSWDERIECLKGNRRLLLNRSTWKLRVENKEIPFHPEWGWQGRHEPRLQYALDLVLNRVKADPQKWVMALRGGLSGRSLALMMMDAHRIPSISWGVRHSEQDETKAEYVKRISEALNLKHRHFDLPEGPSSFDRMAEKVLLLNEGRTDSMAEYTDELALWASLAGEGVEGILKADDAFGGKHFRRKDETRRSAGLTLLADFSNRERLRALKIREQTLPDSLERMEGESLATWRDRLHQEFTVPFVMAAKDDLHYAYGELSKPFLSRDMIRCVRKMPDAMRNGKRLFKKIVTAVSPRKAIGDDTLAADQMKLLKSEEAVSWVKRQLQDEMSLKVFSKEFIRDIEKFLTIQKKMDDVRQNKEFQEKRQGVLDTLKILLGLKSKRTSIDAHVLAFRAALVIFMNKVLIKDGAFLKKEGG